jgi:exonuclease III
MATESRTLRVLQQNVQGNLQAKVRLLTQRKRRDRPHIITLQETGISQLPNAKAFAPGYTLFATGPAQSPFQGVAILLENRLAEFVRGTEIDKHGRYVILSLRIPSNNKWRTLMIASAYLPSGLETKNADHADYLQAQRIHDTLCDRAQHHDATIVAGDFNAEPGSPAHAAALATLGAHGGASGAARAGAEPAFTTFKFRGAGAAPVAALRTVDYVFFARGAGLAVAARRRLPAAAADVGPEGLPCEGCPSDHLPVAVRFVWE